MYEDSPVNKLPYSNDHLIYRPSTVREYGRNRPPIPLRTSLRASRLPESLRVEQETTLPQQQNIPRLYHSDTDLQLAHVLQEQGVHGRYEEQSHSLHWDNR